MTRNPRILIVEDNPTTAKTVQVFLKSAGYDFAWEASGDTGLVRLRDECFDLLILDLMLPGLDGIGVCRRVREQSDMPIVMLTAKSGEEDIVDGLEAGADDYVCKPFGSKELLARIRRCLARSTDATERSSVIEAGSIRLDADQRRVQVDGGTIRLTKSEFDILCLLMRYPGRVFTRDQIIGQALGPDFDGYDRTIDTHIWGLRKKLKEPRGAPRHLLSELGVGYRFVDRAED